MPILMSSGRTAKDARQEPKALSLNDDVEDDLWKLIGRLTRELRQLRRLGPAPPHSDETFSPDEIPVLMRDIEYLVTEGSEVGAVLTPRLKQGLRRVLTFLQQAERTNAFVHARVE